MRYPRGVVHDRLASAIEERFPSARCVIDAAGVRVEVTVHDMTYRARAQMEPVGRVAVQLPSTDGFELSVSWTDRGRSVDLIHYSVVSGSGLISWTVAAPPDALSIELPDLSRLPQGDLLPGEVRVLASLASVENFDYARLEIDQLRRFSWQAYALDVAFTRYARSQP